MLDTDVRANGLQRDLKLLQRDRPARGRWRGGIDPAAWDPECSTEVPEHLRELWWNAKRECDALLKRVMRRDPDELFSIASR